MSWRKSGDNYIADRSAHYCDICLLWHEDIAIEQFSDRSYHVRTGPHYQGGGFETPKAAGEHFRDHIKPKITKWRDRDDI